jgi:hypothetical protein
LIASKEKTGAQDDRQCRDRIKLIVAFVALRAKVLLSAQLLSLSGLIIMTTSHHVDVVIVFVITHACSC